MRLNAFWFGVLMMLCPFVIGYAVTMAQIERGYVAFGGEVLLLLIPCVLILWRAGTVQREACEEENQRNEVE